MIRNPIKWSKTCTLSRNAKAAVFFGSLCATAGIAMMWPAMALAATDNIAPYFGEVSKLESGVSSKPMLLMLALVGVSLLPFVGMMVTSFVKIAVVLSITRQAIGVQQAPPTTVITGLAILLTIYVMQPVGMKIYASAEKFMQAKNEDFFDKANVDLIFKVVATAEQPMKKFLRTHASDKNIQMFYRIGQKMREPQDKASITPNDFIVLIPSFVISELTKAFQIGFIIFLPFMVVDLAISNILMALGMQMLSPTTVSLPFKILLFVMVDGWYLITKGLVLGYQV
jgi:type III secretion protein R